MRQLNALEQTALRALAGMASAWGGRSLLVLTYHRVLAAPDPMLPDEPDVALFEAQVDLLSRLFTVLPLSGAARLLASRKLPSRALCITFDDGYANNLTLAQPILARYGLEATVFVATDFLDGGMMWNDVVIEAARRAPQHLDLSGLGLGVHELPDFAARRSLVRHVIDSVKYRQPSERRDVAQMIAARVGGVAPSSVMLTTGQLRSLPGLGMHVGAHTMGHPILAQVAPQDAEREIRGSREFLEAAIGQPVEVFAYPNGRPGRDYGATHVDIVRRCGFACAVSTAWGSAHHGSDIHQLPRVAPWDRVPSRYALRLIRGYRERSPAIA